MSDKDPFSDFESDRTVIKPRAGRGPRPVAPAAAEAEGVQETAALPEPPGIAGLNPLLQAAAVMLRAGTRMRGMARHPDPLALRGSLAEAVRQFESSVRRQGLPNEQLLAGRYILCSFLDECASDTPWGAGTWSQHSLLVEFHNEAWGGEKVFQLASKLAEDVPRHRNLLELLHVVLALGFEGRYRVLDNGKSQLESVRERLAQLLRDHAPAPERELSPHWTGVAPRDAGLRDGLPVWVAGVAVAFVLMLAFMALRFSIHDRTDPTFRSLQALDVKVAPVPAPIAVVSAAPPPARLSSLLQPEIDAGRIEVRDLADRSVVTIRGDGFFEPGRAEVADAVKPLLGRIGHAMGQVAGSVLVTGHTDNQPIRTLRFPSNWHLSQERAAAVGALLASTVKLERLRTEGRADAQPVDDNATPAGRARNRRVEITLLVPAGA